MDVEPPASRPSEAEIVRPGSTTLGPRPKVVAARFRTLLLVDDEADILNALANVMRAELGDDNVLAASSGPAALVLMRDRRIGAILTDYRMPGMTGFELVTKAREIDPQILALMMTAYPDPELLERAQREYGILRVLSKPFPVKQMVAVVLAALDGNPIPEQTGP